MEFTREAWENAPEGARLEWSENIARWADAHLIGFRKTGEPIVEASGDVRITHNDRLRIVLPKRKVTVQLWQSPKAKSLATKILEVDTWDAAYNSWTLLGEHTFEIERE